jgi:hypothetical protein
MAVLPHSVQSKLTKKFDRTTATSGWAGGSWEGVIVSLTGKLTRDGWLLFATRCSRMFAYGLLSVVLVLYLVVVGLKEWEVGLLLWSGTR